MNILVYEIEVSPNLYPGLQIKSTIFSEEQDAIDSVSEALRQNNIHFTIKQTKTKKVFINNKEGELATIQPLITNQLR